MTFRRTPASRAAVRSGLALLAAGLSLAGLAPADPPRVERSIQAYRDRMVAQRAAPREAAPADEPRLGTFSLEPLAEPAEPANGQPARAAVLVRPTTMSTVTAEEVLREIPDPSDAAAVYARRLERLTQQQVSQDDQRVVRAYERIVEQATRYVAKLARPRQVRLSLTECVQRAIAHNYAVRIQSYNPAISETQIVEAEARFDVEFFFDWNWANLDRATASSLTPGYNDTRRLEGGFRQLLPTGAQAQIAMNHTRTKNSFPEEFQEINPVYNTSFVGQIRQPLLRGFGLEVNRAEIELRKVDYRVSLHEFEARVRQTILDTETAYWQLVQARRTVAILSESTAQNLFTYENMVERLEHDATQVEVANAESQYQSALVRLLESIKLVKDAEDQLKNRINDPELKLSEDMEIVPIETPFTEAMMLDQFAEVRTALDERAEIRQARERIEGARINTMVAKNQILPQLDLTFQYESEGIGSSADNSGDSLVHNRFISYTLGASFSYSFGERRGRAQWTRSRLQESQAIVALNQITDAVVEEVNTAVRTLLVRYEQLPPALLAVTAAERNLRSNQARTQRIDPNYLQTELSAVEQLSNARQTLLRVVTDYNVGVLQLENAKGTLLDHNNIVVVDDVRTN